MDMPINVPVDDPNADTEWNDILRQHKIIPEKPPSPTAKIQEALQEAREEAYERRLESADLDALDELEDVEDEAFLERYRQQRRDELSSIAKSSIHNQVYPIQKVDFTRDVTEASYKTFVAVHLSSSFGANTESRLLTDLWRQMAAKYGDLKFCEIRAIMCIQAYPEKNTPTILIYKDGDIKRQLVTLRELNGIKTSIRDLEILLVQLGAIQANDYRVLDSLKLTDEDSKSSIRPGKMSTSTMHCNIDDDDTFD